MAKIVKFPKSTPQKFGYKKIKSRKKLNLEDYGQLNLFDELEGGKTVELPGRISFFEKALMLDEVGDKGAEKYYLQAIKLKERQADAYCNLGILKSQEGDLIGATEMLSMSLKENPRHFEAHYNLGNVYVEIGNLTLAQAHFELAISMNEHFENSYYNLALLHITQKNYQGAEKYLEKYIELADDGNQKNANELLSLIKELSGNLQTG